MRNKMLACLRYNLKKLLSSPVTYLVIVLTVLFVIGGLVFHKADRASQ